MICAGTRRIRFRHLRNPIRHLILADPPPHAPMKDMLLIYSVHFMKNLLLWARLPHIYIWNNKLKCAKDATCERLLTWRFSHKVQGSRFKVQGFFICHIIVIQGITRSEMQSNQVRSVTVQNNKNTNYISNITQGHTYGKKRRNKNKMCNEIKKCKTIRCAKNNKMCKRQWDVQKKNKMCKKTIRCTKKENKKTVYWDLINSNVNKRDVQTGCSWYCT